MYRDVDMCAAKQEAARIWREMTDKEKNLVRFGMFPAQKMKDAAVVDGKLLAVALMDIASAKGGTIS